MIELAWSHAVGRDRGGRRPCRDAAAAGLPKTIDFTVDYLRAGLPRDAYARARVNRSGRRYASVHVEAWQDNRARLFAQATGHFLMPPPVQGGRDRRSPTPGSWRIALPIVLSNATVPLLGAVDTGVVGQLGQAAPIGAVGLGAVILATLYWVFGFLRMGTTAWPRRRMARATGPSGRRCCCGR